MVSQQGTGLERLCTIQSQEGWTPWFLPTWETAAAGPDEMTGLFCLPPHYFLQLAMENKGTASPGNQGASGMHGSALSKAKAEGPTSSGKGAEPVLDWDSFSAAEITPRDLPLTHLPTFWPIPRHLGLTCLGVTSGGMQARWSLRWTLTLAQTGPGGEGYKVHSPDPHQYSLASCSWAKYSSSGGLSAQARPLLGGRTVW